MSIDGTLPAGPRSDYEIIFSCHFSLTVAFHSTKFTSKMSVTVQNVKIQTGVTSLSRKTLLFLCSAHTTTALVRHSAGEHPISVPLLCFITIRIRGRDESI